VCIGFAPDDAHAGRHRAPWRRIAPHDLLAAAFAGGDRKRSIDRHILTGSVKAKAAELRKSEHAA